MLFERSIFTYAKSNEYETIKLLLKDDDIDVNERDDYGRSALHICASNSKNDCLETVRVILSHPNVQLDLPDYESGWTPLHRALYFKNYRIALTLIKAGAKLGDEYYSDYKSLMTPRKDLYRSVRNWNKWTPNIDHEGNTPLDLLSCSLVHTLKNILNHSPNNNTNKILKNKRLCTSVLTFGKSDLTLGVMLPNNPYLDINRPKRIETLESISFGLNGLESIREICASKYHSVAVTTLGW